MVRQWYIWLKIAKLIYERIYFIVKYIVFNTKFTKWYAWAYSKYTHRIYIIVDVDDLHKQFSLESQLREGYPRLFAEPLRRFIFNRYLTYNENYNRSKSKEYQVKQELEELKKGEPDE